MSSTGFGEQIHPTDRIREVLNAYSFSSAILREILANSDDAGATEQKIALDCRTHPQERILHPEISDTQGPAVLAYNNSVFKKEDWNAIQFIGHSSKTKSTSKIGKFGLGIRSCYHITDYLQILSGENLLIFDPLRTFSEEGGIRVTFNHGNINHIRDHFTAFSHFLPTGWNGERFDGTIVRLPLRNKPGLREKTLSPNDIEDLFRSFIQKDLRICLLFVNLVRTITLDLVTEQGSVNEMASCTVGVDSQRGFDTKIMQLQVLGVHSQDEWLMVHEHYPLKAVLETLASRVGTPTLNKVLEGSKLCPDISIAFPLHFEVQSTNAANIGQLFTFLPLPVKTGFPAHVHALFALDSSRQHLCMNRDSGTMQGSENQIYDEWNRVLFEAVIPHAWSKLLSNVAGAQNSALNVFSAWPDPQLFATDGESALWRTFTEAVLSTVLERKLSVWPVVGGGHFPLKDVFIFSHDSDVGVAKALGRIGLKVCGPVPQFLFDLVAATPEWSQRNLTPENTSAVLRDNFQAQLRQASGDRPEDLRAILEYLLSNPRVSNIAELPIIPTVSGHFISLSTSNTTTVYTLLEPQERDLFDVCDPNAVHINDLPSSTRKWFKEAAPGELNLSLLDPARVIQYLSQHPTRNNVDLASVRLEDASISFLTRFWVWVGGWHHTAMLLPQLRSTRLLPCVGNGLEDADPETPVFDPAPVETDSTLYKSLRNLEVPFLLPVDPQVKGVLRKYGFLSSPCEAKILLRTLDRTIAASAATLSTEQAQRLLSHFNAYMAYARPSDYDETEVQALRALPIFPIVEVTATGHQLHVNERCFSVEAVTVYGVERESFEALPNLPNIVFVDVPAVSRGVLAILNNQAPTPLTFPMILDIALDRHALVRQPRKLLAAILNRAVAREKELTGRLKDKMRSQVFVASEGNTTEAPSRLIDPSSPLRALYANDPKRLPRAHDDVDRQLVSSLSSMGLLDRDLSKENIEDRIRYIADNDRFDFSVELLNILSRFDCRRLDLDDQIPWLPTQKGTLAPGSECRPGRGRGTGHDERLFDKVLEMISPRVGTVPATLIAKMHWDHPIPVDILRRQLVHVLQDGGDGTIRRVEVVLEELSKRKLSRTEFSQLRHALDGRAWVPVSGIHGDLLVESWQAVCSEDVFSGIHRIKANLRSSTNRRKFLRDLGCLDEPSFDTVKRRLDQLTSLEQQSQEKLDIVAPVLDTLRFCSKKLTLSNEQREQLQVPDQEGRLHDIGKTVFNDIGQNSIIVPLPAEQHIAHDDISDALAASLKLERLGLKYIDLNTLGEDMGASPEDLVRESLSDYEVRQFLPEFLANAEDAGASTFEVITSNGIASQGRFLSTPMGELCTGPSVIIYNDSRFTEADFEGICRTRTGGKGNRDDTIGQFGLGALTMFHITECAFIFSGSKVLILDPSKSYLPLEPKRASSLLDIDRVMTLYPGHIDCLRNLPCFDSNARQVNGTVFFLPLRTSLKATGGKPSLSTQAFRDVHAFNEVVLAQFQVLAPEILLFPQRVRHIEAFARQTPGPEPLRSLWSITAERSVPTNHGDFVEYGVSVTSRLRGRSSGHRSSQWLIVSQTINLADIPQNFRTNKLRKHVRLGLAAPLCGLTTPSTPFEPKLHSMLPLPIQHTLPVHINASFILSSDRRNIRFDAYDDEASCFNGWIVDAATPSLYLSLLERLAHLNGGQDNASWFPGAPLGTDTRLPVAKEGELTSRLTKQFYGTHLPNSTRRVFKSMFTGQLLTPKEAVLHPSDTTPSTVITKAFNLLRHQSLVKLNSACRRRAEQGGVTVAGPPFLKQTLATRLDICAIRAQLSQEEIRELLSYLSQPNVEQLHGLPLMHLADRSWATFQPQSGPSARYFFYETEGLMDSSLFPQSRFIYPGYIDPRLLGGGRASSTINIRLLDAAGIRQLVEERLDTLAHQRVVGEWIDRFWTSYRHFQFRYEGLIQAIEDLPLVPTTNPGVFKSLVEFKDGGALLIREDETARARWFQEMGITVVSSDGLPPSLHDLLHYGKYSPKVNTFISFLRCVGPVIDSAITTVQGWPFDRQREFSQHMRSLMSVNTSIPPELRATARRIPLFIARQGNIIKHCPATEVHLLPSDLDITAGRFCDRFMTDDDLVATKLGETRLNISQLHDRLQLPAQLEQGEDEATYRTLLRYLLTSERIRTGQWRIQVPNANRRMVSPQDLYERSTFFIAAFGASSSQFLLPSFDGFASRLPVKRGSELSMGIFARCTLAFQAGLEPETNDGVERAAVLYGVYRERLPLLIPESDPSQWHQAEGIRFIPRELEETTRDVMGLRVDLPPALLSLPQVVAPQRIVLRRYHPIAWTQRVIMIDEPEAGSRLLLAYQGFGRPSGREVIAHLKALVTYPPGPVIQSDLRDTYKWLNDNADSLEDEILELRDELVFLNVDNPNYDEWSWHKASELAFKAQDVPGAWQAVRRFLQPFHKFLEAAGVLEFKYPKVERQDQGAMREREHTSFRGMRDTFNEMRLAGQLTDIHITPQDASTLTNLEALRAHRVFLAACNPWFKAMFTEGFREATEDARIAATQSSLESLIGYYYTGTAFPQAEVELDDFLDTLDLAHFVEDDAFLTSAQRQIIDSGRIQELVDPRFLDYVLGRAEAKNANLLVAWCQNYRDLNEALLLDMPTADSEGHLEMETDTEPSGDLTANPPSSTIN